MSKRILIVDDDRVVLLVYHDALMSLQGCEVATAKDAEDALKRVAEEHFDVIVTDLSLPGLSGVQFTERVRAMGRDVPIIWVTAYGCHNVGDRGDDLDVCTCLDKPIEIANIRRVVREVLANSNGR